VRSPGPLVLFPGFSVKALFFAIAALLALSAGPARAAQVPPGIEGSDRTGDLLALANRMEATRPLEALRAAKVGILLARQDGDQEKEMAFLSSAAYCSSQTGDLAQAVAYANEALTLSTRLGNRERMAKAHNILGITYTFMGSYSRALDEELEALRIREQLGLESASLQSMNLIGVIYHHSGQYPKAIEYYQKILDRMAGKSDPPRTILVNLNIGFSKYKMGRFQEALEHHLMALELSRKTKDNPYLLYAYVNLGLAYTDLGNYPEAARYLHMALAGYQVDDQKYGRVQVLNALGRLDLLSGKVDHGITWAREGAALSELIQARDELKTSYELLASLYEKKGDYPDALKFYKLYASTKDSIFSNQESEKIADISMRIVSLKKDHEIGSLKNEKVISSLKLQKERYFSLLLGSGIITLSLFVLVLSISGKKTRNSKVLLEATNAKLQALNAELQETVREVKTLSGLLPICAKCKKIRDDDGYWQQLEGYISKHTSATFSHGICPHCAEDLYPEVMEARRCRHGEAEAVP
jgi:tetratricopeptide (TPR) repeat protein